MYFQLKELILWPRKPSLPPRRLPFGLGKVTVISGASRTGKSAVIPIIDYCLGAGSCSIPVKTIRDACQWFGIVVKTESGEKLLARLEPGEHRCTDDMFLLEAPEITAIPDEITKNTTADNVRHLLDEVAGLSNLDFSERGESGGFEARPSFRDLMALVFQPQNVVANPEVLFFKTDHYEHREKLRRIFPYVLGAITPALLAKQHELGRLRRELRRKESELTKAEAVSAEWTGELRAKVSEARELGLLPPPENGELSRDQMLDALDGLVKKTDATIAVSQSTVSAAIKELNGLEDEETAVSHELTALRRRLTEMTRIRESASSYGDALRIQRDRLQIADWLGQHASGEEDCPICGARMESSSARLAEMVDSLHRIEKEAGTSQDIPAAFERETERVQAALSDVTERLKAIRIRKDALSQRSDEARTQQFQAKKVERFVGNLENALQLHRRLGEDAELRAEVSGLRARVTALQEELAGQNLEARKRRALKIVNNNAARLIPMLDCERPEDPVSLDIDDLTVKVTGASREDYLSEIGSGSNWLSYHIAVFLGLQQFFLTLKHSPVPGFVVMDQPSQVYFPRKLVVREDDELQEPQLRDEDIAAVHKAFRVLGDVVGSGGGRLQVIVLDHAPREVWGNIPNVVAFEEWREGRKLVPQEWLD